MLLKCTSSMIGVQGEWILLDLAHHLPSHTGRSSLPIHIYPQTPSAHLYLYLFTLPRHQIIFTYTCLSPDTIRSPVPTSLPPHTIKQSVLFTTGQHWITCNHIFFYLLNPSGPTLVYHMSSYTTGSSVPPLIYPHTPSDHLYIHVSPLTPSVPTLIYP